MVAQTHDSTARTFGLYDIRATLSISRGLLLEDVPFFGCHSAGVILRHSGALLLLILANPRSVCPTGTTLEKSSRRLLCD